MESYYVGNVCDLQKCVVQFNMHQGTLHHGSIYLHIFMLKSSISVVCGADGGKKYADRGSKSC